MKTIEAVDVDHAWSQAARLVLEHAQPRSPRGLSCYGLPWPVLMRITQPRRRVLANPVRRASVAYMAAEFSWIFTGSNDLSRIRFFNENMAKFSDDNLTLWGAYGPRFQDQLHGVLEKLRKDHHTRQAVMTFWRPNPPETKDVPCTVALMFKRQGRYLDLTAVMRSNDLWLGFPYDVFTFTLIQEVVASALGMDVGHYYHIANDLHLYEANVDATREAVKVACDTPTMPPFLTGNLDGLEQDLNMADNLLRDRAVVQEGEFPTEKLARWLSLQMVRKRHLEFAPGQWRFEV